MKFVNVTRHDPSQQKNQHDFLALEQALNVDLVYGQAHLKNQTRLATTMRMPGHDRELLVGLLYSLGIIESYQDILDIIPCRRNNLDPYATDKITIFLDEKIKFLPEAKGIGHPRFSSCGVCGSLDLLPLKTSSSTKNIVSVRASLLPLLPQKMKEKQIIFHKTGGTHAAAFFTTNGDNMTVFEDVGRHNALDKLIGHLLMKNALPMSSGVLLMSSRASYEIIEKAARAGIKIVATMGAVSSLAVELAEFYTMTLVGFLQPGRFNVYSHDERIV